MHQDARDPVHSGYKMATGNTVQQGATSRETRTGNRAEPACLIGRMRIPHLRSPTRRRQRVSISNLIRVSRNWSERVQANFCDLCCLWLFDRYQHRCKFLTNISPPLSRKEHRSSTSSLEQFEVSPDAEPHAGGAPRLAETPSASARTWSYTCFRIQSLTTRWKSLSFM